MQYSRYIVAFAALAAAPLSASPQNNSVRPAPEAQASVASRAVDAQTLEVARRLLSLVSPEEAQEKEWLKQIRVGAEQVFANVPDDEGRAEMQTAFDQALAKVAPGLKKRLPQLNEAYAQAYARAYSAEELRQIIVFVETPTGRRFFTDSDAILSDPGVKTANEDMMSEFSTAVFEEASKAVCRQKAAVRVAAGDADAKCPFA